MLYLFDQLLTRSEQCQLKLLPASAQSQGQNDNNNNSYYTTTSSSSSSRHQPAFVAESVMYATSIQQAKEANIEEMLGNLNKWVISCKLCVYMCVCIVCMYEFAFIYMYLRIFTIWIIIRIIIRCKL